MINNHHWKRVATVMITAAGLTCVSAANGSPATAAMCMVDCWSEDGGWAGGGGLGGNPNTGTGGGGSDHGRVGSGGYEGPRLDRYAPSGNGWNDSRLPKPKAQPTHQESRPTPGKVPVGSGTDKGTAEQSGELATVLTTDVDVWDPGHVDLTGAIEALKRAQADRDREFADPESTEVSREFMQELVDQAEEAVNRAMNDQHQQVCVTKPYLPQC